jgi:plasmid stability protein
MASLSLRGIPDEVYEGLRQLAALNHRSMQEQARLMLEREVRAARPEVWDSIQAWRTRLEGRSFPNVIDDLRSDRER